MGQIATSANASFDMIANNQKCIEKNPGLLTTATSLMAGVGAAIAPINPAIGLLMTAGSVFTRSAIDGIRKNKQAKKIRTIADTTITLEAYSCALEKMSANWCQMQDAKSFIDFKSRNRIELRRNPTLANAISLNDREVPVLMDWLNKIRSGISPTTTSDAKRQADALDREVALKKCDGQVNGLIEQNRKVYESSTDQWTFLKNNIISNLVSEASSTAMTEIYPSEFAPYYLSGIDDPNDPRIRDRDGNIREFRNWEKPSDLTVTLDSVKSRFLPWMNRATALVNRELAEVQQPDPLRTLTLANVESEPWQIRPLSALRNITNFLKANLPKEPAYQKLYTDTITRLDTIHDVTASAVFVGDRSEGSMDTVNYQLNQKSAIEIIYEEAQLNYGTIVLFDRLEMIIRISLLEYLKNASEEDQILVAQLLASDRFSETLGKMSGTSSLARLSKDLKNGQAYTNENLSAFMDIFGHNINRTLGRLYQEEKQVSPTTAISKRDLRTSLCFLSLTAENASEWIDSAYCNGLKMEAVESGGPETLTISDSTFNLDLKERMCVYHDYFRRSDIYQKSRIRTMKTRKTTVRR